MPFFCSCFTARAQYLSFRHLSVQEGMPTNYMSHACFDSSGLIWASTSDGLVAYDGTGLKQYISETHPGLPTNETQYLFCDSHNRIWICTGKGLAMLDEHRRLKRIIISDTLKNHDVDYCIEAKGAGIIAIAPNTTYILPEGKEKWEPFNWFDAKVRRGNGISGITPYNESSFLLMAGKRAMLADLAKQKVITDIELKNTSRASLCKINRNEILVVNGASFELYRINITTNTVSEIYSGLVNEEGKKIETTTAYCAAGTNGIVYITTRSEGLIAFDPSAGRVVHTYRHDPLNENSVSSNNLRRVNCHPNGYLLIAGTTGLNYTNLLAPVMQQYNKFADSEGNVIDNILMAGEDAAGRIWLGSIDKLFIWDRGTNKVRNISPAAELTGNKNNTSGDEAASIYRDNKDFMWVSFNGRGLAKFSSNGSLLKFLTEEQEHLPTNRIRIIRQLQNGMLMLGAEDGLFMMNPETFAIDSFAKDPALKAISKRRVVHIFPDGDEVWIATSTRGAAYCYNFKTLSLKTWSTENGLNSTRVYCITKDFYGNTYIGTYDGLNVVSPDGKISYINKGSGLRHTRIDNLVTDKQGLVWITNFNTLICYNPADKSFSYYDEQNGVSRAGFIVGQAQVIKDNQLLFCSNGLLIARQQVNGALKPVPQELVVNRLYDDGGYYPLDSSAVLRLKYDNAKISFYYLVNNFMGSSQAIYRCKMDGLDTGWAQPTKNNQVTYNLSPGKYVFHIQSSYNEGEWAESKRKVTIIVLPPWWQTLWFRLGTAALLSLALYVLYRRRIKKIKTKAAIQQQITELESKALRAQMNPHFIFNSLNAIQELIVTKKVDEGYQYLSNFSKLLRQVLNNSEKNLIPLSSEIEMINLQLSLESLRFKNAFKYSVEVDENIEPEMVNVPPLLLQPYVENAVWHGLRHKEGDKNLWIRIKETGQQLNIEIEDNGVGRQRAEEIKKNKLGAEQFESKGSLLSAQRIKLLAGEHHGAAAVNIADNKNEKGEATGTIVKITLPSGLK